MKKQKLINKIKFMEVALNQGEKLNLLCRPIYDIEGDFISLKLFLMDEDMSESAVLNPDNNYYMVFKYHNIECKETKIKMYIDSFCKCDKEKINEYEMKDLFDELKPEDKEPICTCKLPSKENAESWWYNEMLKNIEARKEDILKYI